MSERTGQRLYIAAIQSLWYGATFIKLQRSRPLIPQQDPSLRNRTTCLARRLSRSMAHIRPLDRPAQLPLLPRHPRRVELEKQQLRQNARSISSSVQHVRASR